MEKIVKYGWTYTANYEGKNAKFNITPDVNKVVPSTLFKLYDLNENSINALFNKYIYATHPCQFNDIFDCHEQLLIFDDKEIIKFFFQTYAGDTMTDEKIDKLLEVEQENAGIFVQRNFRELIYKQFGVFSMTDNPMNILMWSYYTNHRGFFIEFDYNHFPFKFHGPFPVNYQSTIDPISIKESGISLGVLLQSNLKDKGWEHENEWRILIESDEYMISPSFEMLKKLGGLDRKFTYPTEAIKSIGIGNRFFEPEELKIDGEILHVNIKFENENKSLFLDFVIDNSLEFYFAQQNGLNRIAFSRIFIEKINSHKYIFKKSK